MIAAFPSFHHGFTAIASLPAFLLCLFHNFSNFGVFGAVSRFVHLVTAKRANLDLAAWAGGGFAALGSMNV